MGSKNLLLEGTTIYGIEVLLKTDVQLNKVEIYNQIRALTGVVVCTVEHSEYLDSRRTENYEYSLVRLKFIVHSVPEADIQEIRMDAMSHTNIKGLLQFIPRFKTMQKKANY